MAKPKSGMVKSNLFIDPKVRKGMRYLAAKRGTSYSALVREAMRKFVIEALTEEKNIAAIEAGSIVSNGDTASNSQ